MESPHARSASFRCCRRERPRTGSSATHRPRLSYRRLSFVNTRLRRRPAINLRVRNRVTLRFSTGRRPSGPPPCPVVRATTAGAASGERFDINGSGRLTRGTFIIVSAWRSPTDANGLTTQDQGGRIGARRPSHGQSMSGSDCTMNRGGNTLVFVTAKTRNLCCRRHGGTISKHHRRTLSDRPGGDRSHSNLAIDG